MKRILVVIALALPAAAGSTEDYAWQWPLTLERDDAGAYRIELAREVYEAAIDPALADMDVLAADGLPVPSALFAPAPEPVAVEAQVELPWFALPSAASPGTPPRWRIRTETGPDRRVQKVETELLDAEAEVPALTDLLLDASAVPGRILALELYWPEQDVPLDAHYRLDYGDDLEHWRHARDGRLVELSNAGHRIMQRRIETGAGAGARYYRLQALDPGRHIEPDRVLAVLAPAQPQAELDWLELDGRRSEADGRVYVEYRNPGRYPVERVDVVMAANSAGEWWLESRDGEDGSWRRRLEPAVAYRLDDAGGQTRSPPRPLSGSVRDRYWRLVARAPARDLPVLRLGYRPEALVFLAQGQGPYVLVAGSGRARRDEAPVSSLLAAQRARHGEAWQPAAAMPGARTESAGTAALEPAPSKRVLDWTAWLLWAVLLFAAVLVGALAFSVLRSSEGPADGGGDRPF